MNSANPFAAHSDVLEATVPSDSVGRQGLLSELKNRGKAAVAAGQWPHARALYEKALLCCVEDGNQKAILYANIALVQGKMNEWGPSQQAAKHAVEADASYTKGWWRLGQAQAALQDFDAAVQSLQEASKLEPNNKALQKELNKHKDSAQKKQAADSAKDQQETEAVANKDAPPVKSKSTVTTKNSAASSSSSSAPVQNQDKDEDTTFSKSEYARGYKIVNGKKTSYFHNELTEEAKQLIGDIAPKKLSSAPTSNAPDAASTTENKGASAWNKAGTWEERDVTSWAMDALQSQLEETMYTLPESSPAPGGVVKTKKAKVSGHASFAVVRGKKRYIYEMAADLEWEFSHQDNDANGKLSFPDIDGTCMVGDPYEATGFHVAHSDEGQLGPVLNTFVHKQGYRDELHKAIDKWVGLFKDTY